MLYFENVSTFYGKIQALHNVDVEVRKGEIVTLIGANGAGKSTLMMSLFGNPKASAGRIVFDGEDITRVHTHEIARRGIALVPEGRRIFPAMTVEENLLLGAFTRSDGDIGKDLQAAYELFPILAERSKQPAGTFSGGEQQMLAMGRAMMSRPQLLMLDEPSMGLSPLMMKRIMTTIRTLQEQGTTILLVEQNAQAALRLANKGYVLEVGKIVLSGTGRDLLKSDDVRKAYLGED